MFPVIKGASYILVHAPSLVLPYGGTQRLERAKNPDSPYLKELPGRLRRYEEVVTYAPNQVFIGNKNPHDLKEVPQPWYKHLLPEALRFGPYGEIMPEDEFYGLLKYVDDFDLVLLETAFAQHVKEKLEGHPLFKSFDLTCLSSGGEMGEIEQAIAEEEAVGLYWDGHLVGCVKRAHEIDENLKAEIMLENLIAKASGTVALTHLLANSGISPQEIDFVIETSEEACGDIYQRGGGNFAKAIVEKAGCANASGCDVRGFCAAPVYGIVMAAGLVSAGVYDQVVVLGGGAAAKLGMNARDHIRKGLPVLEDVLGGFAVLIGPDDGVNPVIRTDVVGKHPVGAGSSPQSVMQSIVSRPLEKAGFKILDIEQFAAELQNPEITVNAGAGDVPAANYKMIGALAVMKGEMGKDELSGFVAKQPPGFAPTQGHIPSGIPFIGHARDAMLKGRLRNAFIIGKGSLFLGRMTKLFDGVSFLLTANPGKTAEREREEAVELTERQVRRFLAEALREIAGKMLCWGDTPCAGNRPDRSPGS